MHTHANGVKARTTKTHVDKHIVKDWRVEDGLRSFLPSWVWEYWQRTCSPSPWDEGQFNIHRSLNGHSTSTPLPVLTPTQWCQEGWMTTDWPYTGGTRVHYKAGNRPVLHLGERQLNLPRPFIRQRPWEQLSACFIRSVKNKKNNKNASDLWRAI